MTKKITLLIVEDHEATLKGLKAELSAEPDIAVVGIASNSEEGLKLAWELKPTVILLDLHLPDSAGPKSLTQNFCSIQNSAVIVFSGDNRTAILSLVLNCGVAGYLLKSEPVAKVVESIRAVVRGEQPIISAELLQNRQPKVTKTEEHLLKMLARGMKYQDMASMRFHLTRNFRKRWAPDRKAFPQQ